MLHGGVDTRVELADFEDWKTAVSSAVKELRAGEVVVDSGERLDPPRIAALAAAGVTEVEVSRRPQVCVLTSGTEVVPAGAAIRNGQVVDTNSPMLRSVDGVAEWLNEVMSPRLDTTSSTAEELAAFQEIAELSRYFGGTPRLGGPESDNDTATVLRPPRRGCGF